MNTRLTGWFLVFLLSATVSPAVADSFEQAERAFAQGEAGQAIADYRRTLKADPHNGVALARLATSYEVTGRLKKAQKQAEKTLRSDPSNVEALLLMGRLQAREGNWIQVRYFYQQVLEVDAEHPSAWLGLGHALEQIGDEAGANAAYDEYINYTAGASPQ